jgi:hypothetical protein
MNMNMKIARRWPIGGTIMLQTKTLGFLLFTLITLTKCSCDRSPQVSTPDQETNLPKEPNPKVILLPITEDMLNKVGKSSLQGFQKNGLLKALKLFKSNQANSQASEELSTGDYEGALSGAMKLADEAIIQALLQRKDQVKGSIDWNLELQKAINLGQVVGVKALLKSGIKVNKEHLETAVEKCSPVAIIKILLDSKLNPQAAELIDQEIFQVALNHTLGHEDSEGGAKANLFVLLDPQVNPKIKTLINQDMLKQTVYYKSEDILQKLLDSQINAHASQLTDEEMIELIHDTFGFSDSGPILNVLLEDLIRKKGKAYMRNLMGKAYNGDSIGHTLSMRDSNKPIFITLGLIDATN